MKTGQITSRLSRTLFLFAAVASGSILMVPVAIAGTYWVDDNGGASWAAAESTSPLSGTLACSMATANANAVAGDTVNIRAGTYSTGIDPKNDGSSGSVITWQAYNSESVTIATGGTAGIYLNGDNYHKVDGVDVDASSSTYQLYITGGSDYNEIANCYFYFDGSPTSAASNIRTFNAREGVDDNNHNWIHDCTFEKGGFVSGGCSDDGGLFDIGADKDLDNFSGNNTVENCVFISGAHHTVKTKTKRNILRNNEISNPENYFDASLNCKTAECTDSNYYGNRCLTILDHNQFTDGYNIIEGNRIGHAGIPVDGNGGYAMTIGASKTLVRYNEFYNTAETGVYLRSSSNSADDISFYNNTVYKTGVNLCRSNPGTNRDGIRVQKGADNANIINNIVSDSVGTEIRSNNTMGLDERGNWLEKTDGSPSFMDTNTPELNFALSSTQPNLNINSGSGCIDNGTYLTQANGSGASSTSLVVDNAYFFQDGTAGSSISNIQADWIAIGSVDNTVQISSIDYGTNTITLGSAMTWSDSDNIWLYKKSDGETVLHGSAPDQGANEFGLNSGAIPNSPFPLVIE